MNPSSTLKVVIGGKNAHVPDPQVSSAVKDEIAEGLRRLNDQNRPWDLRAIHGYRLLESLASDARFADAAQFIIPEVARATLRKGHRNLDSLSSNLSPTDFELFPEDVRIGNSVLERLSRLGSVFSSGGEVARGTVWLLGCASDNQLGCIEALRRVFSHCTAQIKDSNWLFDGVAQSSIQILAHRYPYALAEKRDFLRLYVEQGDSQIAAAAFSALDQTGRGILAPAELIGDLYRAAGDRTSRFGELSCAHNVGIIPGADDVFRDALQYCWEGSSDRVAFRNSLAAVRQGTQSSFLTPILRDFQSRGGYDPGFFARMISELKRIDW